MSDNPKPSLATLVWGQALQKFQNAHMGANRRGYKVLLTGETGSGKSYNAASFPGPRAVFEADPSCGMAQYLDPKTDVYFTPNDPTDPLSFIRAFRQFCDDVKKNETAIGSVVIEGGSFVSSWFNDGSAKEMNKAELQTTDWKVVKPDFLNQWIKLLGPYNLVVTTPIQDTVWDESEAAPGEKGKLSIRKVLLPKIEKHLPALMDFMFLLELQRSKKEVPTGKFEATALKCRRPKTVEPSLMFIGKEWMFDGRKENSFYDTVLLPIREAWLTQAIDTLNLDPVEADQLTTIAMAGLDAATTDLIRKIEGCKKADDLVKLWSSEIGPLVNTMTEYHWSKVVEAKDKAKKALGVPGQ